LLARLAFSSATAQQRLGVGGLADLEQVQPAPP